VVAVRDVPLGHEDRRQPLTAEHLLQVFQHARIGQRKRVAPGGPQDVVGPPADDGELPQFRRHLPGPVLTEPDAEVAGGGGIIVLGDVILPVQVRDRFGSAHGLLSSRRGRSSLG